MHFIFHFNPHKLTKILGFDIIYKLNIRTKRGEYNLININELNKDEALRYLGYKGQNIDEAMTSIIDSAAKQCLETSRPSYIFKVFDITHGENAVEITGSGLFLEGSDIYKHLLGCTKVAIMAVTIGAGFDNRLNLLQTTDNTKSLIFNSCGSALVEQVCDEVESEILKQTGLCAHNFRFSPGYGDLSLETQKIIFRLLLPEKTAGITLTPSNLLVPIKSVTAILGLSQTKNEIITDKCSVCSLRDTCALKKGGNTCEHPRVLKK